jgi:hydroxyacylglutathione hydrolase
MADLIQIPVLNDNYIYLLHDPATGATAVIDPAEASPVLAALHSRGWNLTHILCTHHHPDHVGGVAELKAATLKTGTGALVVGAEGDRRRIPLLDLAVKDQSLVKVGSLQARVLDTPGHTVGHICYWFEGQHLLFCGDTLFSLGCGRLFEGTPEQMWHSISRLSALPDETQLCCAHEYTQANARFAVTIEPDNQALKDRIEQIRDLRAKNLPTVPTNLGLERATNPFLRARNAENFARIRQLKDHF